MKEIHELLNHRWILKKKDPEIYFRLKDEYEYYKSFFQEKLGYNIIINPLLIKAEKIPGRSESWMGIREFDSKMAYVFLCLVLMFLEEKETEEQFVLSQITEYVQNNYPGEEKIDWTIFTQRKTLIKVLRFCLEEGMILLSDGDDSLFSGSPASMEVLYENTGTSKYFMRRFPYEISQIQKTEDFEEIEWQTEERDRGIIRRHRVYRRLVMSPVVYQEPGDDQDYQYIKNQRSVIESDFEKYLEGDFHLHKNGALLMVHEDVNLADGLPNRKNISDIVLQLCTFLTGEIRENRLPRDESDCLKLSLIKWDNLIQETIEIYRDGWSKTYRELSFDKLREEINQTMVDFKMLSFDRENNEVTLYPIIGKLNGDYPKDYWNRKEITD